MIGIIGIEGVGNHTYTPIRHVFHGRSSLNLRVSDSLRLPYRIQSWGHETQGIRVLNCFLGRLTLKASTWCISISLCRHNACSFHYEPWSDDFVVVVEAPYALVAESVDLIHHIDSDACSIWDNCYVHMNKCSVKLICPHCSNDHIQEW